jgi:hypothetical protein
MVVYVILKMLQASKIYLHCRLERLRFSQAHNTEATAPLWNIADESQLEKLYILQTTISNKRRQTLLETCAIIKRIGTCDM